MQGFYPSNLNQNFQGIIPYAYGTQDPSVVATPGTQGQLFLRLPQGELFRKLDNGNNTNWEVLNITGGASSLYEVSEFGPFTTIQSAINQAVADGHTDNSNAAIIVVYPKNGFYEEIVTLSPGIHVQGASLTLTDATKIRGGFRFTGAYSGNSNLDYSSISNLFIEDNLSGDPCIEYSTTTFTTLAIEKININKVNTTAAGVLQNAPNGSLICASLILNSTQNCVGLDVINGGILSLFEFSTINGCLRAIRKNGPDQIVLTSFIINHNQDNAAILIEQGTVIFSLGSVSNNNPGLNAGAFFVNNGSVLVVNTATIIVSDNITNKAIQGQAGGTFVYLLPVFATANNRVEVALTSVLQNTTPNFV